jgi:hypothetical protein
MKACAMAIAVLAAFVGLMPRVAVAADGSPPAQIACQMQVPEKAPALGMGTVAGFEDRADSLARIPQSEKALGGKIDPAYTDIPRVIVNLDSGQSTVFAVPSTMVVHVGDRVTAQGIGRSPKLGCNYIPYLITADLGGGPSDGKSPMPVRGVPIVLAGRLNYPAVDCEVDSVAGRCILDSGSMDTAVNVPDTAAFAALPTLATRHMMGAGGVAVSTDQVRVGAIHVGDFEMKAPDHAYRGPLPDPNPVLGLDFFKAMQTVTFDFHAMALSRDPPSGRLCPDRFKADSMIEVPADFAGQAMQAGWDTGAGATVVDAALLARHPELFQYVKDFPAEDATGKAVPAKIYTTSAFTLCGIKLNNMPVGVLDLSEARKKKPDLPEVVFGDNLFMGHVWAFDFRDGRWSIN